MLEYKGVHRNKFHQELVDAGIQVIYAFGIDDSPYGIKLHLAEGYDEQKLKAVLDAHNPSPPLEPLSREDRVAEMEQMINLILIGGM